jgi:alpha-tubulin suppressor-like RCC1 family protein
LCSSAASAEPASQPGATQAGTLDLGAGFSCAIVAGGQVKCWGSGGDGELGLPGVTEVGAAATPAAHPPIDLGSGFTATSISSGDFHTCAIRNDGSVVCWGYGGEGRLGYGSLLNVGDVATPGSVGAVKLPGGQPAVAITAGDSHTCAILASGQVSCWGFGYNGELGYGADPSTRRGRNLGGTPTTTPDLNPTVDLGGHTAVAISACGAHTCAILDSHQISCWGYGGEGRLGYGDPFGDPYTGFVFAPVDSTASPPTVMTVALPAGLTAAAISTGGAQTCAILSDGSVHCWGFGFTGQLGDGRTGGSFVPGAAVNLGGHQAVAIGSGQAHSCALLDSGQVECWGWGTNGRLGYGATANVGDSPATEPGVVGPVNLGGHAALAIAAGDAHTCARLDDGKLVCWGYGAGGQLGYCNTANVGDAPVNTPGAVGPVNLIAGDGGRQCASPPAAAPVSSPPPAPLAPAEPVVPSIPGPAPVRNATDDDRLRARRFRSCLAAVNVATRHLVAQTRRGTKSRRAQARRRLARERAAGRASCVRRWGHTPGRVTRLTARAHGHTSVTLSFAAPGSRGYSPPAATGYLVKQSLRPIATKSAFMRAPALCKGACRFKVSTVDTTITLAVTALRPGTVYYFAVAALDNVTGRVGPPSRTVAANTGR